MDSEALIGFSDQIHVCWFQWQVSQPFSTDERWAFILTTNCDPKLIHSFSFQVTFGDQGDRNIVVDSGTDKNYVSSTGITNIQISHYENFQDDSFGFLLPSSYANREDALSTMSYTYTVNLIAP